MKLFLLIIGCLVAYNSYAAEQAQQIFESYSSSLFQIRLIENSSGEKSSIGSGFLISSDGLIATNYHVVSGFAQHPDKYHVEYVDHLGGKGKLSLIRVDVINDLALLKLKDHSIQTFFPISKSSPERGQEIYSLGNPHDLGMIVVPGTYNGLKKDSFTDRIHFTGAVNSGMSGGPVVNKEGQVVGVNVASGGNQLGFLVPHGKLLTLLQGVDGQQQGVKEQIAEQLIARQKRLFDTLMAEKWQQKSIGDASIPHIDLPYIRCWGESNSDDPKALIHSVTSSCSLNERVYISRDFQSGKVDMEFTWLSADELNKHRFYRLYQRRISYARAENRVTENDVTEFQCQHDLVVLGQQEAGSVSKSILCSRAYKEYSGLYDVMFISALVEKENRGLISHFTLAGVDKDTALAFSQRFMETISWR